MEYTGKLHQKGNVQSFGDNGFTKRDFVLYTKNGEYENYAAFELQKSNCALIDKIAIGTDVTVEFDIRGREWSSPQGIKYFNNLVVWKVKANSTAQQQTNDNDGLDGEIPIAASVAENEGDDLPF